MIHKKEERKNSPKVELIAAGLVSTELLRKITEATFDVRNEWFFADGAFNTNTIDINNCNSWLTERFVAKYEGELFAYFDGAWSRPLDIIVAFRTMNFKPDLGYAFVTALFKYLDYLFVNRGCIAFNWTVAVKNIYALNQYERFIKHFCGHKAGARTHAQKSYTGIISDIN